MRVYSFFSFYDIIYCENRGDGYMNDEYNSILKEKKVYEESTSEIKHPMLKKFMFLGIFLSLIVIVVSYIVYYNTVLSSDSVLLNNSLKLLDKYSVISKGLSFNYDLSNNYMLDGSITIDNVNYDYSFIKDNNKIKRTFSNDDRSVLYYFDSDLNYMKLSSLGDSYIEKDNSLYSMDDYFKDYQSISNGIYNYFYNILLSSSVDSLYNRLYNIDNYNYIINNIRCNFNNYIDGDKYIKKFYFYNERPVVEVDLVLNTNDINKILGNGDNNLELSDDYNINIVSKNDAIMNDIVEVKIIINNKTKDTREVISYIDGNIVYVDSKGISNKMVLSEKDNDFILKFYKDDVLYSVLSGKREDDKYNYTYQVIDKIENVSLEVLNNKNEYSYLLSSNLNNNISTILIDGVYSSDGAIEEDIDGVIRYDDMNDIQKNIINNSIKNILFVQ